MNTIRLNITMPLDIGTKVKSMRNCSAFLTAAAKEKIEREKKEKLDRFLEEGYKARAEEDMALNAEFDHMIGDGI